MSFDGYTNPLPTTEGTAAPAEPQVGYGEDIGKGVVGGLGRGVAGTVGIGGTMGNLVRAGLSKAGVSDETLDKAAAVSRVLAQHPLLPGFSLFNAPDAGEVQKGIEKYTGDFYEPKTIPGQYASTLAEFAPAAIAGPETLLPRVANTVASALTSETAGQLTKGTAAEPYARFFGGLFGGPAAGKIITPAAPAPAAYQAAVRTLEGEGIPLSAGQRTGSKAIKMFESNAADMPGSGARAAELNANTANAYDRAVTERLYDRGELTARGVPPDVNLPDPRVSVAGPASLGATYDRINANDLISNPQLHNRMTAAQNEYERLVLPHNRSSVVEDTRNAIVDRLVAGQGRMAGDEYQSIRSQIGDAERAATNSAEQAALRELKASMDEAMARGLPPQEAAALALNNRRYANMKQVEPAVAAAAGGNLSPQRVAQTVRAGRGANYSAQRGDLDELAQAANLVMKPLANSNTAARLGMQKLFDIPKWLALSGTGAGAGMLGLGPIGAIAGAVAPLAASRLALSRAGQAYLGNTLMPQNARDAVTQALMQQAISQPSGIASNQASRAAYEQKRKDDLRKMGFE
jgi:hypothetical protein